jgi:hypothetical protein
LRHLSVRRLSRLAIGGREKVRTTDRKARLEV